jgi:L-serine dehydratase
MVCAQLRAVGITVELYGSLALTGKGHGTDRAILLGLLGETPELVDPATVEAKISRIAETHSLRLLGTSTINFDPERELAFHRNAMIPVHTNGMRFTELRVSTSLLGVPTKQETMMVDPNNGNKQIANGIAQRRRPQWK